MSIINNSWERQSALFNKDKNFGASSGLAGLSYKDNSNYSNVLNNNPARSWESESALWSNTPDYSATTGTSEFAPAVVDEEGGLLDGLTNTLGNRDLMAGVQGIGQLGLGLANYLQMKPMYEEQLKALEQNRDIQRERFNRHKASSDAFRSGSVEDRV